VPCRSPEEAADIFWSLARTQQFTLFEHYQADEAGHAQDFAKAHEALATFDAFARAVVERRPENQAVLITSDHGNVEDLSSKQHTRHPVPLLAFGVEEGLLHGTETVADVGRLILRLNKTAREDAA
jgi:phosphopentomutase